ncbi:YeiH family protein [Ruminococcus sp. Marseille-P6503]|uniref:YeiH family protein n=1 Tax=Ruminococcus sp. Marseille-P6503 TaxID=2364796 RepID=UPI000F52D41B|nr:YeiH family protein [Ruminococcus sp. Marseille-P6503]
MSFIKKNWAGITLCLCISVPVWFLGRLVPVVGGPVFAIIAGMILTLFIKDKSSIQSGITFTSKKVLQYAVILLGFGLNLSTILRIGKQSLPVIVSTIATSLIVAFALHKLMKIPSKISTLIGVGSSICGGSAIAATAPVIDADDEEIAQSISVIFLFNVIAALIFPTLGGALGLTNEGFGLFAGTAVNDTSSVTAAASAWDGIHNSNTLDTATIVKLTRTLAIIPITLVLAFVRMRSEKNKAADESGRKVSLKKIFPMFIVYFVIASVITTVVMSAFEGNSAALDTANSIFGFLKDLSKFFIIMAMSAIGINTNIVKLVKTGGKPIFMGFCCWVAIAAASLGMQHIIGVW